MIIIEAKIFNKKGEVTFQSVEPYPGEERLLAEERYDFLHGFIDNDKDTQKYFSWVTMRIED